MKKINSAALESMNKALGLSGTGSPVTELTDAIVDQVIEVGPIVRRSLTQAQTGGIYSAQIRNIHTAAESLTGSVTPYLGGTSAKAPYPSPMPAAFDVWLLGAAVTQVSGTGTLSAALSVQYPTSVMGLTNKGGALTTTVMNTAHWDTVVVENTTFGVSTGELGVPFRKIGLRLPRATGTLIIFGSTSSAAATFDCFMTLGVFPTALGQDVLV